MDKKELMNRIRNAPLTKDKIDAVSWLEPLINDPMVLECLCATANESIDYRLREAIISTLKKNKTMANRYFIGCANQSSNAVHRRWSLVNLSLMECRTAKEVILKGLKDSSRSIRIAAALNAGLYNDKEFRKALDNFFMEKEIADPPGRSTTRDKAAGVEYERR